MKNIIKLLLTFIIFISLNISYAKEKINVVVSYPYIESIVKEIGKDKVNVFSLSTGNEDPHFVVPRPSFIAKLRNADILIINGASLEIGFVPPLIRQANNPRINPGSKGFLDLSQYVSIIDKPTKVSRTEGDVHPEGNPHFHLDYYNLKPIAKAITDCLIANAPDDTSYFSQNYKNFLQLLEKKIAEWDRKSKVLSDKKIIQYHRLFNYLFKRTNIIIFNEIEPKPGIPPTARHTEDIIASAKTQNIYAVIIDVYHDKKAAEEISKKLNIPLIVLPHDVNSINNVNNIFSLFDYLIGRLTND